MARGRMISKTLGSSRRFKLVEKHAPELAEFARLIYVLCVSHADDWGRLEGDAFTVKHRVFPVTERPVSDFAQALDALHESGLIVWYKVEDRHIIEVTQFSEHQSGLHKRTASKFPPPHGSRADGPSSVAPAQTESPPGIQPRARETVAAYMKLYQEILSQPYMQSRIQMEKDNDAASALCAAYGDDDVKRIMVAFLELNEDHPKAKLLRGSRRTLPMLLTMAAPIASKLDIQGVVA